MIYTHTQCGCLGIRSFLAAAVFSLYFLAFTGTPLAQRSSTCVPCATHCVCVLCLVVYLVVMYMCELFRHMHVHWCVLLGIHRFNSEEVEFG